MRSPYRGRTEKRGRQRDAFNGVSRIQICLRRVKITIAVKSCFAGLSSDGFDFIRGLDLGLHLNEMKISSLLCNDFIKLTKNEPGAITELIRKQLNI